MEMIRQQGVSTKLAQLTEAARAYASQAKAENTIRAYRSDWKDFTKWCAGHGIVSLPATPDTVAVYMTALAGEGKKPATISRRMASISKAHSAERYESPTAMKHTRVAEVWQGIKRSLGTAQCVKAPAETHVLKGMLARLPENVLGVRDRALLLLGFAGAFRRSELVALDVADVQETHEGLVVNLRKSKTDQEGAGRKVGIPYGSTLETCPVRMLKEWLKVSGITAGALFPSISRHGRTGLRLTDQSVALIVKRYVPAGLDKAVYSGHSLRAGLATSAAVAGASERSIMDQTRHKSVAMVRRYIRDSNLFRDNAAARVGL